MTNVRFLGPARALRHDDNSLVTPLELLQGMAEDSKDSPAESAIVILLNRNDGNDFDLSWRVSNLRNYEIVAALDIVKMLALSEIGYSVESPSD